MWFGSQEGLTKYNGKNFSYLLDGLTGMQVKQIYRDQSDNTIMAISRHIFKVSIKRPGGNSRILQSFGLREIDNFSWQEH